MRTALGWRVWLALGYWLTLGLIAWLAPDIAPHPPQLQDLDRPLLPPAWLPGGDWDLPLGSDSLGRCLLSRLIFGSRVVFVVALLAALGSALIGTTLGLLAGYIKGWPGRLIALLMDTWMAFPAVVLAMLLMVALEPGFANVILAIILVDWTRFCRVIRSETRQLATRDYVLAARITGASPLAVIGRDLLPGVMPTLIVMTSLSMGSAIVTESILAFVGMSVDPGVPSWGTMIAQGLDNALSAPWQLLPPLLATVSAILASIMLGTGLRYASRGPAASGGVTVP
ncbi:hypothetical protein AFK24_26785 [Pseudomonas syringae]|uniref:ABC transmembrane type-1 domain-containing protein n=1 Tax=Pseudomonas syringae TaxID=317 RepID=A0A1C7YWK1_PSESX|nr:ABC transporter permease [Pseudomonas syringae]OCR22051.1 hypothetical protein AFK24_26785 [Pseudomonas syringae]